LIRARANLIQAKADKINGDMFLDSFESCKIEADPLWDDTEFIDRLCEAISKRLAGNEPNLI